MMYGIKDVVVKEQDQELSDLKTKITKKQKAKQILKTVIHELLYNPNYIIAILSGF